MLDLKYLLYVEVVIAVAAFAQGFTGLGFGIIALAGIALTPWDIERTTVVLNLLLVVLCLSVVLSDYHQKKIAWKLVGVISCGVCIGVPVGYWFIYNYGEMTIFRTYLGVVLILFSIHGFFRPRISNKIHIGFGTIAGVIGGLFAGAFSAGGPPIAIFVYSRVKNPVDASRILQVVFMVASLWRLLFVVLFGKGISLNIMKIVFISIPVVVMFSVIGHYYANRISRNAFLKTVYTFIVIAGATNIYKGFQ